MHLGPTKKSECTTDKAVIEGEEGLKSLAPLSTAHKVHLTSLYKVAADNLG